MATATEHIRRLHVRHRDREYFISNLAVMLGAAVPIGEALESLQQSSRSRRFDSVIGQLKHDIEDGLPLWRALERSGVVSAQTLALVRLGEESGKLVDNLQVAARQEEKQRVFRSKIQSALLYPCFVLSLTLVVGVGIAWFLLPRLSDTFSQLHVQLPLISRLLINFGLFLKEYGLQTVPAAFAILALIIYFAFAHPSTRFTGQYLLFHTPGVAKLLREIEVARFGYLLGTLLETGLSVTQSLQFLHDATSAAQYKRFYRYLQDAFENGYSFNKSLPEYRRAGQLLPSSAQRVIIAGERSGALPGALQSVGRIYEQRADSTAQNLETILEPILLVFVWLGVLMIAIAVILPIYSLVGGLGV